jgi:hypothetical protein
MPLSVAEFVGDPHSLIGVSEQFLIFYSSVVDGELWCPVLTWPFLFDRHTDSSS